MSIPKSNFSAKNQAATKQSFAKIASLAKVSDWNAIINEVDCIPLNLLADNPKLVIIYLLSLTESGSRHLLLELIDFLVNYEAIQDVVVARACRALLLSEEWELCLKFESKANHLKPSLKKAALKNIGIAIAKQKKKEKTLNHEDIDLCSPLELKTSSLVNKWRMLSLGNICVVAQASSLHSFQDKIINDLRKSASRLMTASISGNRPIENYYKTHKNVWINNEGTVWSESESEPPPKIDLPNSFEENSLNTEENSLELVISVAKDSCGYYEWVANRLPSLGLLRYDRFKDSAIHVHSAHLKLAESTLHYASEQKNEIVCRKKLFCKNLIVPRLSIFDFSTHPLLPQIYKLKNKSPSSLPCTSDLPRRFFIRRTDTSRRPVTNEDILSKKLKDEYHCESIILSEMNLSAKIQLFSNAELIVGCYGAGLVHTHFSSGNTKILELLPACQSALQSTALRICFAQISQLRDLNHYQVLNYWNPYTTEWEIDIDLVTSVLDFMLDH